MESKFKTLKSCLKCCVKSLESQITCQVAGETQGVELVGRISLDLNLSELKKYDLIITQRQLSKW